MKIRKHLPHIAIVIFMLGTTLLTSVYCAIFIFRRIPFSEHLRLQATENLQENSSVLINHLIGSRPQNHLWFLPATIVFAIIRKLIPPVDNLSRRFYPNRHATLPRLPEFEPEIQHELSRLRLQSNGSLNRTFSFKLLNFCGTIVFFLLVFICFLLISSIFEQTFSMTEKASRQFVQTSANISNEIKELPAIYKDIKQPRISATKKTSGAEKKKLTQVAKKTKIK